MFAVGKPAYNLPCPFGSLHTPTLGVSSIANHKLQPARPPCGDAGGEIGKLGYDASVASTVDGLPFSRFFHFPFSCQGNYELGFGRVFFLSLEGSFFFLDLI